MVYSRGTGEVVLRGWYLGRIATWCQEMTRFAKRNPKCSACGSGRLHEGLCPKVGEYIAWRRRTEFILEPACPKCSVCESGRLHEGLCPRVGEHIAWCDVGYNKDAEGLGRPMKLPWTLCKVPFYFLLSIKVLNWHSSGVLLCWKCTQQWIRTRIACGSRFDPLPGIQILCEIRVVHRAGCVFGSICDTANVEERLFAILTTGSKLVPCRAIITVTGISRQHYYALVWETNRL